MSGKSQPQTMAEYLEWAKATLALDLTLAKFRNQYETNVRLALNTIQATPFYQGLSQALTDAEAAYRTLHGAPLFMGEAEVPLVVKSYESVLDKCFRQNVLWNSDFPNERKHGWTTPATWYSQLNDLVRGTVVCKFLDGPSFLADALVEYAKKQGLKSRAYSQQRDEGYYAFHFYATFDVELMDDNWVSTHHEVTMEIQLATQLQEVLKEMTHSFYEKTRLMPTAKDADKWKWEHGTNRFRASYLSHTLHLLEAIVVDLRDANKKAPH